MTSRRTHCLSPAEGVEASPPKPSSWECPSMGGSKVDWEVHEPTNAPRPTEKVSMKATQMASTKLGLSKRPKHPIIAPPVAEAIQNEAKLKRNTGRACLSFVRPRCRFTWHQRSSNDFCSTASTGPLRGCEKNCSLSVCRNRTCWGVFVERRLLTSMFGEGSWTTSMLARSCRHRFHARNLRTGLKSIPIPRGSTI